MRKLGNIYTTGEKLAFSSCLFEKEIETIPALTIQYDKIYDELEQYKIIIKKDYTVTVHYGSKRSKKYALRTLYNLIQNDKLYVGIIEDAPRFKLRGIIEGFYGIPWSHEDRLDVIKFLDEEDMNAYIYAPKDDLYHRDLWREEYPKEDLKKLLELIKESSYRDIDFYFSISPGKDFDYTLEDDFKALFKKIDAVIDYGVSSFCLLLDDIDYKLEGSSLKQFETPGKAHSYICNRLNEHLSEKLHQYYYIMCPTEYWQNYDTPYRKDIKENLDQNIDVFWTGFNTIAEFIPNEDGENVKEYFGHELVLWDNYPVNDVTTDLLFMGPLQNRGNQLHTTHKGFVSNPMIQWSLSKIPILTMSEYMWNPESYNPEESYDRALKHFTNSEEQYLAFKNVISNFRYSIIHYAKDENIEAFIKNKDITKIDAYYKKLKDDLLVLTEFDDQRFLTQFKPWLERIMIDSEIVAHIQNNETDQVKEKIALATESQYTVGSNVAIKLAKELGLYEGKVYKKYRINFWE